MRRIPLLGDDGDFEVRVVGDSLHDCLSGWFESPGDGIPVALCHV
jgi:hypothetical protein